MQKTLLITLLLLTSLYYSNSNAQNLDQYVEVAPTSPWIQKQEIPAEHFSMGEDLDSAFLLVNKQQKYTKNIDEEFSHFSIILHTPNGVEEEATLQIVFDPQYEKVKLHHIHIIRDKTVIDKLDLSQLDLYRTESDRNRRQYNGNLELSYIIPDVRTGDILDYAYSVIGKNPAFKDNFSTVFYNQYRVPVQKLYQRILIDNNINISQKSFQDAPKPSEEKTDEFTSYTWDLKNTEGLISDSSLPYWYNSYPKTIFSSFKTWKDLSIFYSDYYPIKGRESEELKRIATQIKKEKHAAKDQLREALDFVQRKIRYVGLEIGKGGYIPRKPEDVLSVRFGDCKDMALLLINILDALNIESVPLLVDSSYKDHIETTLPSLHAFDHVIVLATIDNEKFALDPTRGVQLGDIDHLQKAMFGKGLIISDNSPGIVNIPMSLPENFMEITDTYDLVSNPDYTTLKTVSTYYMKEADSTYNWYKSDGIEAIEKSYLEYYQDDFPSIEQTEPLAIDVSEDLGRMKITGYYKIPNAWTISEKDNIKKIEIYANDINDELPTFEGSSRKSPYHLTHPARIKQTVNMILDDSWNLSNKNESYSNAAFDFTRNTKFDNNTYTREYQYQTKADHILPSDFEAIMSTVKKIRNTVGTVLSHDLNENNDTKETAFIIAAAIYIAVALTVNLIIAVKYINSDIEWRDKQIFYPVSMKKFIPLSIATLGIYQTYWIYKNWQWALDVQGQKLSPIWRTIFGVFTNILLYKRISKTEPRGYKWFKYSVWPLGLLYLILSLSEGIPEDSPIALQLVSMTLLPASLIPVAMQINKMNEDRTEYIEKNSKYGWQAIGMVTSLLPFTIYVIYITVNP